MSPTNKPLDVLHSGCFGSRTTPTKLTPENVSSPEFVGQIAILYSLLCLLCRESQSSDEGIIPPSAVSQFNAFIRRVASNTTTAIVLIAGNHDSEDRMDAMSLIADTERALIRGPLVADEKPLIVNDEFGPVAFSALPCGYE